MKKTDISFREIINAIRKFEFPDFDLVIAIAEGGVVPGSLVAYAIGSDLEIIKVNYRDCDNMILYPQPVIQSDIFQPPDKCDILLVDDVSVTGKTLGRVRALFKNHTVKTMVFKGEADYVLFPQINNCVNWPWKVRE